MFLLIGSAFLNIVLFGFGSTPKQPHVVAPKTIAPALTLIPTIELTPTIGSRNDIPGIPVYQSNNTFGTNSSSMMLNAQSRSANIVNSLSLIDQINSLRSSKTVAPISENNETCAFASTRANEISSNFNHDGFTNRANSNSLPYPSFSSVAENIAMNSDASQVVPNWINSPGHAENLLKDIPYGCVANSGNYYTFEAWKP